MRRGEFSPDGSRMAILRSDGSIDVLHMLTNCAIVQLPKPDGTDFERFAISGDNLRLAVTRSDGSIHVHEIRLNGRETTVLSGPPEPYVVAFGPDGPDGPDDWTLAVAGGKDGAVRLYRFGSRAAVKTLADLHNRRVLSLAFSPDGRLASGDSDGMVLLRDVASGLTVAAFGPHRDRKGELNRPGDLWDVDRLVFIGGGEALVSGQAQGAREVWDVGKGSRLARLHYAGGTVSSVDISPKEHRVAVLHDDRTVSLRDWDHDTMLKDACEIVGRNLGCAEWRQFLAGSPYHKTCPDLPAPEPACD
jgi:WD40 repeat protein